MLDVRQKKEALFVHNAQHAIECFSPASTFKIPHSLFALDAGVLRTEFDVFPWDEICRPAPAWNTDQTLRSAMRHSTAWVYEKFAQQIGQQQALQYLESIDYGNKPVTGDKPFWVEGDLAISAYEQIAFLRKLYANTLPFQVAHQRLVKDVMTNEAGSNWILREKSDGG